MRMTRNWGKVGTGEAFEALVTTLIFFEDSCARLFGARGADGGQDARSGDGETVFQAKHHVKPTASKAVADAKREAEKIAKYRAVGHSRSGEWASVQHWILVTNASFGPTDEATWQAEVVPEFLKLGLTAKYWEEATLDGYLDKHPEVDRSFFENETRVFLSPPEARLQVADDDPFIRRADLAPYVGRQSELAELDAFLLGSKRYLQVHAAGGIGKTRFVLEVACRIAAKGDWQVLWANVHSMASSSKWFDAIVPERPTLLVVDDPDDESLMQRIKEQIGRRGGRAQQWKVAIAVRSTNDPILQALRHPGFKRWMDELMLTPLPTAECEEMCRKLLESGRLAELDSTWRDETSKVLARRFDGYPIWLSLAVHLLEEEGSLAKLPTTASGLCQRYLDEALKNGKADLLQLVRWVALLGPINRQDEPELQHLAERAGYTELSEVHEALKRLVSGRLLRKWGAHDRLVDVKPDVLRDFILRGWFCEERDYGERRYVPSEAAKALSAELSKSLSDGSAGRREERVLAALARVDFLLRYEEDPADLSTSLFGALNAALPSMTPRQRTAMIEKISAVGPYYPEAVVQILRRLRLERATDETVEFFGRTRTYSQADVVLALAYAHHRVGRGMLTDEQGRQVFEELYALALEEKRIAPALPYGLPNDGKRAESVIRNLLEGGPSYCREFGEVAAEVVLGELGNHGKDAFQSDRLLALQAIVKPLCDVQRHQTWSEGFTIQMRTQLLFEGHANRKGAAKVLPRIRAIIELDGSPVYDEARVVLWDMLTDAHRQANFAKGQLADDETEAIAELNTYLLDDLKWVQAVLDQRTVSPRELRAAREIWHWHFEFGTDEEPGALATQLEAKYMADPVVQLFEDLTNWDHPDETRRKIDGKASELAEAGTAAIQEFLTRAAQYLGNEDMRRVFSVANSLGRLAATHKSVRSFFVDGFRDYQHGGAAYQFVIAGIADWVASRRRETSDSAAQLVKDLLEAAIPVKQVHLLKVLYLANYCHDELLLNSGSEMDLVRAQRSLFVESKCVKDYVACTLWGLRHDWVGLKANLERACEGASREVRGDVTAQLVKRLHEILASGASSTLPSDLLEWFWNQVVETHDLGRLDHEGQWYLGEIVKALGKVPMPRLVDAVRRRAAWHEQAGWLGYDPPAKLIALVEPIATANVGQPEIQRAVGELVAVLGESALMEQWLPKLLARVDPQGLEVPRRLAALIETQDDPENVAKLVKAACYYGVGTPSWRHIAREAFKGAQTMQNDKRVHVYYSSSETGNRSYGGTAGTVAQFFVDAVEAANRGLQDEEERDFVPFWEWRKQKADSEFRHEQEKLKEEVSE